MTTNANQGLLVIEPNTFCGIRFVTATIKPGVCPTLIEIRDALGGIDKITIPEEAVRAYLDTKGIRNCKYLFFTKDEHGDKFAKMAAFRVDYGGTFHSTSHGKYWSTKRVDDRSTAGELWSNKGWTPGEVVIEQLPNHLEIKDVMILIPEQ